MNESKGLLADVRPGAVDVTGHQRELFPFDAFEYSSSLTGADDVLKLKSGWTLDVTQGVLAEKPLTTDDEFLNVDLLKAGSITAAKINVNDLFAESIVFSGSIESDDYVGGSGGSGVKLDPVNGLYEFHGSIYATDGELSGRLLVTDGTKSIEVSDAEIKFTASTIFGGTAVSKVFGNSGGGLNLVGGGLTGVVLDDGRTTSAKLQWTGNVLLPLLTGANLGSGLNPWERAHIRSTGSSAEGQLVFWSFPSTATQNQVFDTVSSLVPWITGFLRVSVIGSFGDQALALARRVSSSSILFTDAASNTTALTVDDGNNSAIGSPLSVGGFIR